MLPKIALFSLIAALGAQAATKDQWRSRSIYQLLTDRFAPSTPGAACDTRMYCGGTWRTLIDRLDYIQGMGFDAVWISPTGEGVEGVTKWGENYHGYWVVDPSAPNPHFGTAEDLRALSDALHSRDMYLMVDVVPNHLASTTEDISDSALATKEGGKLYFKERGDFHEPCNIHWGNATSEQVCWLARDGVALMDLATERPHVASRLNDFIRDYSATGLYDGYRVDAVKHVSKQFQHEWCQTGGAFCIGEFYDSSTNKAAELTRGDGIDSVFGFGMMYAAKGVFTEDRPMNYLTNYANEAATLYGNPTVIGSILDNHDLPRFGSLTSDKSKIYNALTLQFLFGGIPTLYYGFEADISFGSNDPDNRNALWLNTDYSGTGETYGRIKRLNDIRKALGAHGGFHEIVGKSVAARDADVAFERNGLLMVLTKRGESASAEWRIAASGLGSNADVVDLLTCTAAKTNSDGSLTVNFVNGMPFAFVTADIAADTGICGDARPSTSASASASSASASTSSLAAESVASASTAASSSPTSSPGVNGGPQPTDSPIVDGVPPSSTQISQDLALPTNPGSGQESVEQAPVENGKHREDQGGQEEDLQLEPPASESARPPAEGDHGGPDEAGDDATLEQVVVTEATQSVDVEHDGGNHGSGIPGVAEHCEDGCGGGPGAETVAGAPAAEVGVKNEEATKDDGESRDEEGPSNTSPFSVPASPAHSPSPLNSSTSIMQQADIRTGANTFQPAAGVPTAQPSASQTGKACKRSRVRRAAGEH